MYCRVIIIILSHCHSVEYHVSLTLSHIQQICSRWLWKHTRIFLKTRFKWKYNYWIELKTWLQKEKLLILSNFFFCLHVFKKAGCSSGVRKCLYEGKGLMSSTEGSIVGSTQKMVVNHNILPSLINPSPHTTNLQQTALKLSKHMENLYNFRYNYWKKLFLSNFTFCHDVFKSRLLQMSQNASIVGKGQQFRYRIFISTWHYEGISSG